MLDDCRLHSAVQISSDREVAPINRVISDDKTITPPYEIGSNISIPRNPLLQNHAVLSARIILVQELVRIIHFRDLAPTTAVKGLQVSWKSDVFEDSI